jgi:subfamily B ATP-binding cassette protein HlyB/CyaB
VHWQWAQSPERASKSEIGMMAVDEPGVQSDAGRAPCDSGLAALVVVAQLNGIATSADHLAHLSGQNGSEDARSLTRMTARLGLKARLICSNVGRIPTTPMPAIAELRNGDFVVLAKCVDGVVLLHDAATGRTYSEALDGFDATWSGRLILVASRAVLAAGGSRFGIAWFVPAIVKYRRQLGEVLVGSFFLQLFGLISPLFMQVVIDKVLVHKSLSTLDVLVFGFVVISIFETLMGGLRAYVFSHTTN